MYITSISEKLWQSRLCSSSCKNLRLHCGEKWPLDRLLGSRHFLATFSVTGFRSYFIIISGHHSCHMWGSDWGLKRLEVKGKSARALFVVYGVWKEELTCHKVTDTAPAGYPEGKQTTFITINYEDLMLCIWSAILDEFKLASTLSYFKLQPFLRLIAKKKKNDCTFTSVGQVLYSIITAITASLRAVAIMDCRKAFIDPAAHLFKLSLTHTVPRREVSIGQVWFIMAVLAAACALHSAEEYIDWL